MCGPLSSTFSDIYMVKLEKTFEVQLTPNFYGKFVIDDMFNRRNVYTKDTSGKQNNYHRKLNQP